MLILKTDRWLRNKWSIEKDVYIFPYTKKYRTICIVWYYYI